MENGDCLPQPGASQIRIAGIVILNEHRLGRDRTEQIRERFGELARQPNDAQEHPLGHLHRRPTHTARRADPPTIAEAMPTLASIDDARVPRTTSDAGDRDVDDGHQSGGSR
jgi:hypothetical protein